MKHLHKTPSLIAGRGRLVLFPLLLFSLLLGGCQKGPLLHILFPGEQTAENSQQAAGSSGKNTLSEQYRAAIKDAEIAEPEEIVTTLTAITPHNPDLTWEEGRVLVATWTDWDGYSGKQGQAMTLKRDVWVTAAQEMRLTCLDWDLEADALNLRLRQLLGLPPSSAHHTVAELWVRPGDLFRPSPDPEITDHEAELDYPLPARSVHISASHRRWMKRNSETSYTENGYPWTRLGYTYDWGNPDSEVGLAEFVVRKGASVVVRSSWPTKDYCSHDGNGDKDENDNND